ncbi:MAG: flagellar basal body-associated FliL family protein, partial [Proteobacteria bacterium]|nr:flagellar basal body-associated FliL family protein [Pseudomonadota bacterium]
MTDLEYVLKTAAGVSSLQNKYFGGLMADDDDGSGSGKKKIIIIAVLVVLLLGGGAAVYFLLFAPDDVEEATKMGGDANAEEKIDNSAQQKDVTKLINPLFTPPKEYNINLRDGKHFLKVEIQAVMEDETVLEYLAMREPIIDDMVITLLGNMTTETLRTPAGRELL